VKDTVYNNIEGHAALSICESMLLALFDLKIMSQKDAQNVLKDAATAHHNEAGGNSLQSEMHKQVATLIDKIIANGNSLPRI
jgi:hypothetical protein